MFPIISCMITYNSKAVVTVSKRNDQEYWVKIYDLVSYELLFEEQIGGNPKNYIKLKEVE